MDFGRFNAMHHRVPAHRLRDDAVERAQAPEAAGFGVSPFAERHASNRCVTPRR